MAVTTWVGARLLGATALPRAGAGQRGGIFALGTVDELPAAGDDPLAVPEGRFWLVHAEEGLLALDQTCTHLDCLLVWGGQAREFICPCHGSRFAADGALLAGPAPRDMDRFPVAISGPDGAITAATDPATGGPLAVDAFATTSAEEPEGAPQTAAQSEPDLYWVEVDTGIRIEGTRAE